MWIEPLLLLLVLLVVIALGRLFKYIEDKGIPQSHALGKVNEQVRHQLSLVFY